MESDTRPALAVWKFASCDGCQLTLLDCEDELLPLADREQHLAAPDRAVVPVAGAVEGDPEHRLVQRIGALDEEFGAAWARAEAEAGRAPEEENR